MLTFSCRRRHFEADAKAAAGGRGECRAIALLLCSDVQNLNAAQRNPRHKQSMCFLKKLNSKPK
jgi:hypothetical protein